MSRNYLDQNCPIVALATAPGKAAIAVIRVSGPDAIKLAAQCFSAPDALCAASGYSIVYGFLVDPKTGERIDEVLASVFRAPHYFTGEDGVEFSCHGSTAVVRRALDALEKAGFAPALPGEFSFRAFLHGKIDLVRAEAIQELANADSESARSEALKRLCGVLSQRIMEARTALIELLAQVEARLDYPDDEGPDIDIDSVDTAATNLRLQLNQLVSTIKNLAASFSRGRIRQEGALVVVAGRPNAGKSSLFNLFLREERSIVSTEPGTTRDWLEAWIELNGQAIRLVDTAGLRMASSSVEQAGIEKSLDLIRSADLVLYLADGCEGLAAEDKEFITSHPEALPLWNKIDAAACAPVPDTWIAISAATGAGLHELEAAISAALAADTALNTHADQAIVASARQKRLLDLSAASLDEAGQELEICLQTGAVTRLDSVALFLRDAANYMGELSGDISSEEIFTKIFGTFCLGK